jgi:protein SCO1/2
MNNKNIQKVVLVSLLVLPFLIYFLFVYLAEETFFVKLDYVGPKQIEEKLVDGKWVSDTNHYTVPDFEFRTQDDTLLSSEELRGKIVLVNFFFSTCPVICPAMNYNVQQVQNRFKGYTDFRIVSISVDPKHDTVEVLKAYEKRIGAINGRWHFLTGNQDSIYKIAEGYLSSAMQDSAAPGGYLHSENLVLVDWEGHIRSRTDEQGNLKGVYNGRSPDEINKLKDDIKVLIAEFEKKKSQKEHQEEKERKRNEKSKKG